MRPELKRLMKLGIIKRDDLPSIDAAEAVLKSYDAVAKLIINVARNSYTYRMQLQLPDEITWGGPELLRAIFLCHMEECPGSDASSTADLLRTLQLEKQEALAAEFKWWYSWVCSLNNNDERASLGHQRALGWLSSELVERGAVPVTSIDFIKETMPEKPTWPQHQFLLHLYQGPWTRVSEYLGPYSPKYKASRWPEVSTDHSSGSAASAAQDTSEPPSQQGTS